MAWMPPDLPDMGDVGGDGLMPGMAKADEMTRLRGATGKDLDILFLQLMIKYHLGGSHMIDVVLASRPAATRGRAPRSDMIAP
jgi:Domain of unknown function (DUF305)